MKERRPDEFALMFACAIDYLEYSIQLPEGSEVACDVIGLARDQDEYSLVAKHNGTTPTVVLLVAKNIPPRRRVGFRPPAATPRAHPFRYVRGHPPRCTPAARHRQTVPRRRCRFARELR